VVLAAVEQNGDALEHARTSLKGERDIVLAAVKRKGCALEFASEELRDDVDVCCWACRSDVRALTLVADPEIQRKARAARMQDVHDQASEDAREQTARLTRHLEEREVNSAAMLRRLELGLDTKKDKKKKKTTDASKENRPLEAARAAWGEKTAMGGQLYRMIEGWRDDNMGKIIKKNSLDLGDPWERKAEKQRPAPPEPELPPQVMMAPGGMMQQQARTVMSLVKKEVFSGPEPDLVSAHLAAIINTMTGTDIDADTPIMESGVDSLMSVELRSQLQSEFKVTLASTVMFNYPTIQGLTDYLVGELTTHQVAGWGKVTFQEVMEEVTIMENVMVPGQMQQQARTVMSLVRKEVFSGPEPDIVSRQISSMIEGMTGTEIDNDTPIMESGIDSLMSVDFRTQLQAEFKVTLGSTVMFNYPTIGGLTDYLVGELTTNQVPGWGKVSIQEVMEEVTVMENVPMQMQQQMAAPAAAAPAAQEVAYQSPDPDLVRSHIFGLVKDMTGSEELDGDTPLMESGLDSLASVDLRTSLQQEFKLDLPSTVMFNYPTMTGLSGYLVEQMEMKQVTWGRKR